LAPEPCVTFFGAPILLFISIRLLLSAFFHETFEKKGAPVQAPLDSQSIQQRLFFKHLARAVSTIFSAVNPYFSSTVPPGADAPNPIDADDLALRAHVALPTHGNAGFHGNAVFEGRRKNPLFNA
jgi:hypothetical protein